MASASLACDSCDDGESELYYCETCAADENAGNDGSNSNGRKLLCEPCLGPHIKRGHLVRTSKGQEPLVCSKHRRLHNQYCKTCDVTFCGNCLGSHSEHKMGSIDERAVEIKKEVFELLTKLELDEKPLRAMKERIIELQKTHDCEQKRLREFVENRIEELRQEMLKKIDQNLQLMEDENRKNDEKIEILLKLQQESRELLSATSPHLIKNFKLAKDQYKKTILGAKALLANYYAKSAEINKVNQCVDNFQTEIVRKLTSIFSTRYSKSLQHFAISDSSGYRTYLFTVCEGLILVEEMKFDRYTGKRLLNSALEQFDFDDHILSHWNILDVSHYCSVILLARSGATYRIDVTRDNTCNLSVISTPSFDKVVCPYTVEASNQIHWCYWLEDRRALEFSHNSSFQVFCGSVPEWKTIGCYDLFLVLERKELLVVDPNKCSSVQKRADSTIWEAIDHVTYYNQFSVFIWCLKSKSIFFTSMDTILRCLDWNDRCQWYDPTALVGSPNGGYYIFLPAVSKEPQSSELNYVFASFRL